MTAAVRDGAPTTFWIVMAVQRWSTLEVDGTPVPADLGPGQPWGWLPVYRTRDEAVTFAGGDESRVYETRWVLL